MKNITVKELKQYLNQRSQDDLIADIVKLYNKLDAVKDYYQREISSTI
ncbi:MAG: hypothetical protein HXX20_09400 [Chloroflexi bacterium]|nr:hypothetical protein [Chloroflexota bacterium]